MRSDGYGARPACANVQRALELCVNTPGDSDTHGLLGGVLVGAHAGTRGLNQRDVERVEDRETLDACITLIHEIIEPGLMTKAAR